MTPEEEQFEWQRIVSELKERDARMLIASAIDSQVNARERAAACFVLGQRRERSVVTDLIDVAYDPSELVSISAIVALSVIGSRKATRQLIRLASNPRVLNVRTAAISALGFIGDPRAEPIMRRFLTNANDLIRSVSASSLSGLRCRRATVDALTDRLERDPNPRVRWAAALTLGHVAGPDWIEILERHLGDDQLVDGIPGQLSVAEGVRDAIVWLRERSLLRR